MELRATKDEAGSASDGPLLSTATNARKSMSVGAAVAWTAGAMGLWATAWTLNLLIGRGTYVFFAPGVNSHTLSMTCALLATAPLIAGIHGFVRLAVHRFESRSARILAKFSGAIIAISLTIALLYAAAGSLIGAPSATYVLQSPHDDRSVLILNRSFLLMGSFQIYEPRTGPIYSRTGRIMTDDGFDPFLNGQYKQTWTDAGLELEYVFDYLRPERFETESIQLVN